MRYLSTGGRLTAEERKFYTDKGLFIYSVREGGGSWRNDTIEKFVYVNHIDDIVVNEPIDLGKDGFITLGEFDGQVVYTLTELLA